MLGSIYRLDRPGGLGDIYGESAASIAACSGNELAPPACVV